jgi:superfamily I DNA/RNA helicase
MDHEALLDALNPEQREVAECRSHCLAVAVPGAGKTKTLAIKAALLLDQGASVTAVTFTRDSAIELRDRIITQAGMEHLPRLLVGTYHSVDLLMAFPGKAKSVMGRDILNKGYSKLRKQWKVTKEGLRRSAVDRAIQASGLELDLQMATALIEAVKAGQHAPSSQEQNLVDVYKQVLDRHQVIDFQDILLLTNAGIKNGDISPLATDHLLLDEFQDTDLPQLEWALAHARNGSISTAVGDDDQSIYAFRRALGYRGMRDYAEALGARTITLGMNYRSYAEILAPADKLIAGNLDRMPKTLVSYRGGGGTISWEHFGERQAEARAIADALEKRWIDGTSETAAVLARTNRRLDDVEAYLVQRGIPYVRSGGSDSILDSAPAAALLGGLHALMTPDRRASDVLLAWYGIPESDLAELHRAFPKGVLAQSGRLNLPTVVPSLSSQGKDTVNRLSRRFDEWRIFLNAGGTGGVRFVVEQLCEDLSLGAKNKRDLRALEVLVEIVVPSGDDREVQDTPLPQRLKELQALQRDNGKDTEQEKTDGTPPVILTTAHSSKGLEYEWVWIVGAEMGTFPDETSAIQEERRLFYVAMTRAKKALWMSGAGTGGVSQFILECGAERAPLGMFRTKV